MATKPKSITQRLHDDITIYGKFNITGLIPRNGVNGTNGSNGSTGVNGHATHETK